MSARVPHLVPTYEVRRGDQVTVAGVTSEVVEVRRGRSQFGTARRQLVLSDGTLLVLPHSTRITVLRCAGLEDVRNEGDDGTMSAYTSSGGDKLPGEPWPAPQEPPTPDGGPGVPNPPKTQGR